MKLPTATTNYVTLEFKTRRQKQKLLLIIS